MEQKKADKDLIMYLLDYEISGSWWASYISNDWLQNQVAKYYYRKVMRKYSRWQEFISLKIKLANGTEK